ncbi:MAG: hypothetical protein DMG27_02890 [Acidobacteria bacterium]|nr:MAG: hypothetical protein DMG27_02890 [Acidobacteriota bacterium]
MDQEKRVLLAFLISIAMLMLWRALFPPPRPPKATAPAPAKATSAQPTAATAMPTPPPKPVPLPVAQGVKTEEIVVEGDLYRVTLSTQGAKVKSWVLKKYFDENEKPLDVVNGPACETLGFPMSIHLDDQALSARLNSAFYVANPPGTALKAPVKVSFTYSDGKVRVEKEFAFGKGYEAHVEASIFDGERYRPLAVAWPGGFGDHSLPIKDAEARSLAVYKAPEEGKPRTMTLTKIKEERLIPGPLELAGSADRFFVGVFLPDSPPDATFRVNVQAWTPPEWKEKEPAKPLEAILASPEQKPLAFRLFVGPKDLDVLRAEKPPLDGLVDFGWFKWFAELLFLPLRYIHDHWIHNWGWAIVILTLLINFAMFPLRLKSIRSAQEMQKVQPLIKSIQEKYKQYKFNDPRKQRMNEEMSKLFKEHNINPLGGCLPMVPQLPILWGFYRLLDLAIELRHAPWALWVRDLSSPDRVHLFGYDFPVLPILLILTTFIVQRMTPMATVDPGQQRMMMIMPIAFGFFFFRLAAGLNLYYVTANIVGIGQQILINRIAPRPSAGLAPAGRQKQPQPSGSGGGGVRNGVL